MADPLPRRFLRAIEPVVTMVFHAPEMWEEYERLGLDAYEGYLCTRAAALGDCSAEVVISTFSVWGPDLVRRYTSALLWEAVQHAPVHGRALYAAHLGQPRRGLLEHGQLTDHGRQFQEDLEHATDQLASAPFDSITRNAGSLLAALESFAARVVAAKGVPTFVLRPE